MKNGHLVTGYWHQVFPGGEQSAAFQDKIRQVFDNGKPGELE
jgi:hypothetical protein